MCGRFALYSDPFTLARRFEADAPPELRPRYNVAPSQNIPIVREEGEKRHFSLANWGLIRIRLTFILGEGPFQFIIRRFINHVPIVLALLFVVMR
jgi:hypothetical protein